ncbi:hypothetical protein DAEQUDRAFT_610577 [Daedalea quercina L-15889]|uniref:F-box domain-containing protein n=1 Tax=Daedalea quercina L-15889 TaxID=1314783 RepID=A0A165LH72_9APHY|nr:hypothetical protein DAEQUDRAFT_610577 [Daedalea quercina L-15889]
MCCIVCKAWLPRCRLHLWARITLRGHQELRTFSRLLSKYRDFGNHVVELTLDLTGSRWQSFPLILVDKLPKVQQICSRNQSVNDDDQGPPLHPQHLTALSSFRSLSTWIVSGLSFQTMASFIRMCAAFPRLECLHCCGTKWRISTGPSLPLYQATLVTSLHISDTILPSMSSLWYMLAALPSLNRLICEFVTWDGEEHISIVPSPMASLQIHELSIRDIDVSSQFVDMLLAVIDPLALDTFRAFPREIDQLRHCARVCDAAGPSLRHLFLGDTSKSSFKASGHTGRHHYSYLIHSYKRIHNRQTIS